MNETHNRFDEVWTDAVAAEASVRERRQVERRYRRVLAMTDDVLGKLEQRNLNRQKELDEVVMRDLAHTLAELPPDARDRFPRARTVQQALDGIFSVQEVLMVVLQRMLHWDKLLASPWDSEDDGINDPLRKRTA
jgi:hypothetical protein